LNREGWIGLFGVLPFGASSGTPCDPALLSDAAEQVRETASAKPAQNGIEIE